MLDVRRDLETEETSFPTAVRHSTELAVCKTLASGKPDGADSEAGKRQYKYV